MDPRPRRSPPRRRGRARRTLTITCMIAPRSRTEPALPTTSRGPSAPTTIVGAIMLVSRRPGVAGPGADEVVLAEHVVQVDAGARDDHAGAGAGRRRERRRVARRRRPTETCVVPPAGAGSARPAATRRCARAPRCDRVARRAAARRARRGSSAAREARRRARASARASPRRATRSPRRVPGPPRATRSSSASPYAISTPPDDGGGFEITSWPR